VAVVPPATPQVIIPSPSPTSTQDVIPVETPKKQQADRYNFLLLGGDYRSHRQTGGDKTDVMLMVSVLMEEPTKITVVQFPRNLFVPVDSFPDMWMFHVYSREGFVGLMYYFQQVFDVDLHGIFYVNMDGFVSLVDGLGGLWLNGVMDGEQTLAYLRDNANNWNYGVYDAGGRQFKVLYALAEKVKTRFHEDALTTAKDLWGAYGNLLETDLSTFEQIHYLAELAWTIATKEYIVDSVRLAEPVVLRGETPLEVRGLVPNENLKSWMAEVLDGQ
jgi:anionic cell wall polymer biosynthesis LytR-Cps2A-Psr (LCP) family protein